MTEYECLMGGVHVLGPVRQRSKVRVGISAAVCVAGMADPRWGMARAKGSWPKFRENRTARSTFLGEGRVLVGADRLNIRHAPPSMDESSCELDFIVSFNLGARTRAGSTVLVTVQSFVRASRIRGFWLDGTVCWLLNSIESMRAANALRTVESPARAWHNPFKPRPWNAIIPESPCGKLCQHPAHVTAGGHRTSFIAMPEPLRHTPHP